MADKAPLLRADAVAVPVAMAVPVNAMAIPVDPNASYGSYGQVAPVVSRCRSLLNYVHFLPT